MNVVLHADTHDDTDHDKTRTDIGIDGCCLILKGSFTLT